MTSSEQMQEATEKTKKLSDHIYEEMDRLIKKFPEDQKQSAVLGALTAAQHENGGYLNTEIMDAVADYLDMPNIAVYEVASFYSMYELETVGRHNVAVCTNISCMLRGSNKIVAHLEKRLGVKLGSSTADGKIYLKKEEECLAACSAGPMMQVNHKYYENLTSEKVDSILDELK